MSRRQSKEGHFGLYKRSNGIWYYFVYDKNGKRHHYSTEEKTKSKAQDYVSDLLMNGDIVHNTSKNRKRLADFAAGFYEYETSPYIQDKLARGYRYSLKLAKTNQSALDRHILPYFQDALLNQLTTAEIKAWLYSLPKTANISNKTANTALTLFRQVLDEAEEQGLIKTNPARKVKPLCKVDEGTKRRIAFTQKEIKLLFAEPWENRTAEAMCLLSAMTGMRYGEVRALKREQVQEDYIIVDASYNDEEGRKVTKSGFSRIVPVSSDLRAFVLAQAHFPGYIFSSDGGRNPVGNKFALRPLEERMHDLGIRPKKGELLTFHSFRHYFNTRLVASGVAGDKIRAVIGHESEEMTEHYAHLEPSDFDEIKRIQCFTLVG